MFPFDDVIMHSDFILFAVTIYSHGLFTNGYFCFTKHLVLILAKEQVYFANDFIVVMYYTIFLLCTVQYIWLWTHFLSG